jgi:hypothetical protein
MSDAVLMCDAEIETGRVHNMYMITSFIIYIWRQALPLGTKFPLKSEGSLSGLLGDVLPSSWRYTLDKAPGCYWKAPRGGCIAGSFFLVLLIAEKECYQRGDPPGTEADHKAEVEAKPKLCFEQASSSFQLPCISPALLADRAGGPYRQPRVHPCLSWPAETARSNQLKGFQSFFMVQPSSGLGILFLTDSDNGLDLVDTVVARFIPGSHPALKFPMLHPQD